MQNNWVESITGGLVLIVSALLLSYAYMKTKSTDTTSYLLEAYFERVDGLNVGSDVRMGGIKIGKVFSQKLDSKNYTAHVVIALDPKVQVPKDSSLAVASESLLGGKYLDIVPGGSADFAKSGDVLENTQSSVNIESLIGKLMFTKNENPA